MKTTALLIAVCIALVGGTLVVARVIPDVDFPDRLPQVQHDDLTAVSVVTTRLERTASASLQWSPGASWRTSAAASGVVTARWVSAGGTVRCGDPIISIDGHAVVAWCGSSPMWRGLPAASLGSDAVDLVRGLVSLGYLDGGAPTAPVLRAAVRAFQADRGLVVDGVLDPADTIWIGDDGGELATDQIAIALGDDVVGATDVLVRTPHLAAARITTVDVAHGAWEFEPLDAPDSHVALRGNGDVATTDLAALEASLASHVDSDALPTDVPGVVQLVTALDAVVVPASAVALDATSGLRCVFDSNGVPRDVELLRSAPDGTLVSGDLHAGELVTTVAAGDRCSN